MKARFEIVNKYILTEDTAVLIIRDNKYQGILQIPIDSELYDVYEVGRHFGQVENVLDELF